MTLDTIQKTSDLCAPRALCRTIHSVQPAGRSGSYEDLLHHFKCARDMGIEA